MTQKVIAGATIVSVVSDALARQTDAIGPCRRGILVIRNGVDGDLFCPPKDRRALRQRLGLSTEEFYWISVGRLALEKGLGELLAAFARVAQADARAKLLLVGDGQAGDFVRRYRMGKLKERVFLAGRRPPMEIPQWLQAADAFVLASHNEGLPNAVLEAMSCGLPVVATDTGGTGEAVIDGVCGLLVPPRDTKRLAEAMIRVSADHALAARLAMKAADGSSAISHGAPRREIVSPCTRRHSIRRSRRQ
jgi:glycosyltransferase involved in cell wall biosynthesis